MDQNCHAELVNKTSVTDRFFQADYILLAVQGMGCPNCATCIQESLLMLDGVYSVDVYLNMAMAEVSFDGQKVSAERLVEGVPRCSKDGCYRFYAQLRLHEVHTYFKG